MSPVTIEFEIDAIANDEGYKLIQTRIERGLSAEGAGPSILREMENIHREMFATRGKGRWQALAPSTQKARRRGWGYYRQSPMAGAGGADPIGVWTGRLMFSATETQGRGSSDVFIAMSRDELQFDIRVPYAPYVFAKRPLFDYDTIQVERLERAYKEYIFEGR